MEHYVWWINTQNRELGIRIHNPPARLMEAYEEYPARQHLWKHENPWCQFTVQNKSNYVNAATLCIKHNPKSYQVGWNGQGMRFKLRINMQLRKWQNKEKKTDTNLGSQHIKKKRRSQELQTAMDNKEALKRERQQDSHRIYTISMNGEGRYIDRVGFVSFNLKPFASHL